MLTMLRQTVKTQEIKRLVDTCYTRYREGFVTNIQKGDVPSRFQSLATYLAKYVVSPPIALRRIDRYDGHCVTYHYRSHKTDRVERETVDVYTFIGRMVPRNFPKFQRVRYYASHEDVCQDQGDDSCSLGEGQGRRPRGHQNHRTMTSASATSAPRARPLRRPQCQRYGSMADSNNLA
jgi:hypothetical protein